MKKGTVKWFNKVKGYGFIAGEDGVDSFVHATNVLLSQKVLVEGQIVEYEVAKQQDGRDAAFNVSVIEG